MHHHPRRPQRDLPHDECRQVLEELQTFLDSECGTDLEQSIRVHLRECPPCLYRADFEVELKAVIASRCSQPAPAGLVEKVIAKLRDTSRAGQATDHRNPYGSEAGGWSGP